MQDIQPKLVAALAETAVMMAVDRIAFKAPMMTPAYMAIDFAWAFGGTMATSFFVEPLENLVPDDMLNDENVATLAQILTTTGISLVGQKAIAGKRQMSPLQVLARTAAGVLAVRELKQREFLA